VAPAPRALLTAAWRWVDPVGDPFTFVDLEGRLLSGDTPGYAALDLGATLPLPRGMPATARLHVANVLDRAYSEVKGYPAQGRAVSVGLTVRP
jgi:outer membrane receptor protein involved in Fe transport